MRPSREKRGISVYLLLGSLIRKLYLWMLSVQRSTLSSESMEKEEDELCQCGRSQQGHLCWSEHMIFPFFPTQSINFCLCSLKSHGLTAWLWLFKDAGQAKAAMKPSSGPSLAWPIWAWLGLAHGLRPGQALLGDKHVSLAQLYLSLVSIGLHLLYVVYCLLLTLPTLLSFLSYK